MAAIVTTVTTVILLGVLIPVFQTTQAKSESSPRQPRIPGRRSTTTRRSGEIIALQRKLEAIPHVASVKSSSARRRR